ncbi:hypothetical protein CRBSH125_12590 [Afipia carboxidovorans]|nr:hypothetical protein CRBSH125_12590 [Afipia carboxidovorans]
MSGGSHRKFFNHLVVFLGFMPGAGREKLFAGHCDQTDKNMRGADVVPAQFWCSARRRRQSSKIGEITLQSADLEVTAQIGADALRGRYGT